MLKVIVYYHDDMDGKCSAAIVKYAYGDLAEIKFVPLMYDDNIELPIDIWNYNRVYILDFTLPERQMDELCTLFARTDVVWIEHHISALRKYEEKYSHFEGIRKDGLAASELTWKFMYGKDVKLPQSVKYISDRDLWKLDDTNVLYFYEWMSSNVSNPYDDWWGRLFLKDEIDNEIIERGQVLRNARLKQMRKDIRRLGYEEELDGYTAFKVNYSSFESVSDAGHYICERLGYDIGWIYYIKKNNEGNFVKIHALRSQEHVDVSEIAVKYGGGGHKNASGFVEYV